METCSTSLVRNTHARAQRITCQSGAIFLAIGSFKRRCLDRSSCSPAAGADQRAFEAPNTDHDVCPGDSLRQPGACTCAGIRPRASAAGWHAPSSNAAAQRHIGGNDTATLSSNDVASEVSLVAQCKSTLGAPGSKHRSTRLRV